MGLMLAKARKAHAACCQMRRTHGSRRPHGQRDRDSAAPCGAMGQMGIFRAATGFGLGLA